MLEDAQAERAYLGILLAHDGAAETYSMALSAADFVNPSHQHIFAAIRELVKRRAAVHLLSVAGELTKGGKREIVGGYAGIAGLTEEVPSAANIGYYADQLRTCSSRRKLSELAITLGKLANDGEISATSLVELAGHHLKAIGDSVSRGEKTDWLSPDSWDEVASRLKVKIPEFRSRFRIRTTGPEEEQYLHFPAGALSVIVAPSGHGKTTFLLNLIADAAKDHPEKRHWFFSFEESKDDIYLKMLNTWADEDFSSGNRKTVESYIRHNSLESVFPGMRDQFLSKFADFGNLIDDGTLSVRFGDFPAEELVARIRQLSRDRPGVILVDYTQLLYLEKASKSRDRREELKLICLALKDVAVETGIPIVLAGQFSREVGHACQMHATKLADAADIERAASKIV